MGIAAIELHLRKLQTYLQDLRGVQKDVASGTGDGKEKGGKSRHKKRFRMLQKKLFQQLNILLTDLTDCVPFSKPQKSPVGMKETSAGDVHQRVSLAEILEKLQNPCEKLLRGLLERLGSNQSDGGRLLTAPIYHVVADCLALIYKHGSRRSLLESMSKWEQQLNEKGSNSATYPLRSAMLHCATKLFAGMGRQLQSYAGSYLACCMRQLKVVATSSADATWVRKNAVICATRVIQMTGIQTASDHLAALKLLVKAQSDKATEVRSAAAETALVLGKIASELSFDAEKTVSLDSLLNTAAKGAEDEDPYLQTAFGSAFGRILAMAAACCSGKMVADVARADHNKAGARKVMTRKKFSLSSTRGKDDSNFDFVSALRYLKGKFVKSSSIRRRGIGTAIALVAFLRSEEVSEKLLQPENVGIILLEVIGFAQLSSGVDIPRSRQRLLGRQTRSSPR